MKTLSSVFLLAVPLLACAPGVVGGPAHNGAPVTLGNYSVTDFTVVRDDCRLGVFPDNLDTMLVSIAVTDTQVSLDFTAFEDRMANGFGPQNGTNTKEVSYAPTYDCTRRQTVTMSAVPDDPNVFQFDVTTQVFMNDESGTQCAEARGGVPAQCESEYSYHFGDNSV